VSALVAGPTRDKARELQRTLYRAAKADPGRRFHALYDKVYRRDILERAWELVRRNRGAAGIDQTTLADVERYGVDRLLDELARELRAHRWRPLAARRVWIPKPGTTEQRPLSIPAVRDRIVQAAVKLVIEPIFEADMLACSFGFRPKRAAHDALQVLLDETWQNRRWVVETDIASCFEAIPHERLMTAIQERICDRQLLKLLRALLRAGVLEDGAVRRPVTGTPQGGVVSPLLANVYLHRLDRAWKTDRDGVLVRYADDLVRHEAPFDRVEIERAPPAGCRSRPLEAGGSPTVEVRGRVGSRPDNDGTGRNHQTARVRQARREGVREEPVSTLRKRRAGSNLVDMGRCAARALRGIGQGDSGDGHKSPSSEAMVKVCGVAVARLPGHSWTPPSSTGRW
jgi:retron-type reverse transcriptase